MERPRSDSVDSLDIKRPFWQLVGNWGKRGQRGQLAVGCDRGSGGELMTWGDRNEDLGVSCRKVDIYVAGEGEKSAADKGA